MEQADDTEIVSKTFEDYVANAEKCISDQQFSEAAYWYFQAYADTNHELFQYAYNRCDDTWIGFDKFLLQFWARGDFNVGTEWEKVEILWKNRVDIKNIYTNTLVPMSKISDIRNRCCKLLGIYSPHKMVTATGFLVEWAGTKFIMTNHHALDHPGAKFLAEFACVGTSETMFSMLDQKFIVNKDLDVGLVIYTNESIKERSHFKMSELGNSNATNAVTLLQHPKGLEIHQAIGVINRNQGESDEIDYTASTDRGSSGSFVLGADWKPIALHKCGVESTSEDNEVSNRGTKFSTIKKWLDNNREDIIPKLLRMGQVSEEMECEFRESKVPGTLAQRLKKIIEMQNSVCQIKTPEISGSGFLAIYKGTRFIVTSNTVIASSASSLSDCIVYLSSRTKKHDEFIYAENPPKEIKLNGEIQYSNKLGVALLGYVYDKDLTCRFHYNLVLDNLGNKAEYFYGKGDAIITFQRPDSASNSGSKMTEIHQSIGTIKKGLTGKNADDIQVYYDASARNGSHGSIVLSAEWKPLAIHMDEDPTCWLNRGTLLSSVVHWMEEEKIVNNFQSGNIDGLDEYDQIVVRKLHDQVEIAKLSKKLERAEEMLEAFISKIPDISLLDKEDRFMIMKWSDKGKNAAFIAKKLSHSIDVIEEVIMEGNEKKFPVFDDDDKFLITRLHQKGKDKREIAEKLNHPEQAIESFIRSLEQPKETPKISGLDELDFQIIRILFKSEKTARQIGNKIGKAESTVVTYLKAVKLIY